MRRLLRAAAIVALVLLLGLAGLGWARAQSGGGYDLSWNTVEAGGGSSSGGGYTLAGTIGQFDAAVSQNGGYSLSGGFWGGAGGHYRVYLPAVSRK